jgi:hypothetical protein
MSFVPKAANLVPTLPVDDQCIYTPGKLTEGQQLWNKFKTERIVRAFAKYVNTKGYHDIEELAQRVASLPTDR